MAPQYVKVSPNRARRLTPEYQRLADVLEPIKGAMEARYLAREAQYYGLSVDELLGEEAAA